jgi:hypothetical protein
MQELLHHGYVKPPEIRVSDWEMPLRIQQVKVCGGCAHAELYLVLEA